MIAQVEQTKDGVNELPRRTKLSINVRGDISERLRKLAYGHRVSESSIVEIALRSLFVRGDDAQLGRLLRQLGATLRSR